MSEKELGVNEEISDLRAEILQSQKARIDLLRFKLIAVATLGGFGFGLVENSGAANHQGSICVLRSFDKMGRWKLQS